MKNLIFILFTTLVIGCTARENHTADFIMHNAKIYTLNQKFEVAEAMAIKNGKILETGTDDSILKHYKASVIQDLQGKTILPGLIDAHAHFFGYGSALQNANLRDTKSWEEILERLKSFAKTHKDGWLLGRGWDQNDWADKEYPTKDSLDKLFPDRPVYLTRIDGHAAIVNQKALDIAGFNENSKLSGGDFIKKNKELTGVLIDNAKDKMATYIPSANDSQVRQILLDAQKECMSLGLTTVQDAGLDYELLQDIQKLQQSGEVKIRLNVMLSDNQKNINWLIKTGKIKQKRLYVNGFKFYGDGALGSRGACLLEDYSDKPHQRGFLLSDVSHFREMAKLMDKYDFQMNTHAIGDSANRVILNVYAEVLKGQNDKRWRIEHAQVINKNDFERFGKYSIIPSVQPTHATSDMYWAGERLGSERLKYAYAYKDLLDQNSWLPLGTDFPIEEVNPILTFYAAVVRKDIKAYPKNGFQTESALTREEALRGMTIWAAKAGFMENESGSLERGKNADFVVLNQDLMTVDEDDILKTEVNQTWISGEKLFDKESEK